MAKSTYIIDDEPATTGKYQKYIVEPMWPLLGVMMAGVWFGWPWLLFNGWALGSPNWKRQAQWLAVGLVGTIVLAVALVAAWDAEIIRTRTQVRLALLAITVWKLGISYKVHGLQLGTFELFRYYGGTVLPGSRLLMLGVYLSRALVFGLVDHVLWLIIISGVIFSADMVAGGI